MQCSFLLLSLVCMNCILVFQEKRHFSVSYVIFLVPCLSSYPETWSLLQILYGVGPLTIAGVNRRPPPFEGTHMLLQYPGQYCGWDPPPPVCPEDCEGRYTVQTKIRQHLSKVYINSPPESMSGELVPKDVLPS